jgi:hypothetical protein
MEGVLKLSTVKLNFRTLFLAYLALGMSMVTHSLASEESQALGDRFTSMSGIVMETMNSGGYTYAFIDTKSGSVWVAAPPTSLKTEDEVIAQDGFLMKAFRSNSLDRVFDEIYFVSAIGHLSKGPATAEAIQLPDGHPDIGKSSEPAFTARPIVEKADGDLTVAALYASRDALKGQKVHLTGVVVKFNSGIMRRNWIHIEDGSGDSAQGNHNLTVTTDEMVEVGETVDLEGVVTLNKDFGAGYRYDLILEDAHVRKRGRGP